MKIDNTDNKISSNNWLLLQNLVTSQYKDMIDTARKISGMAETVFYP